MHLTPDFFANNFVFLYDAESRQPRQQGRGYQLRRETMFVVVRSKTYLELDAFGPLRFARSGNGRWCATKIEARMSSIRQVRFIPQVGILLDEHCVRRRRRSLALTDTTSDEESTLEALARACVAGDRDAMQQIYSRCCARVYALMVRIVGRQDADDLTQQVFLQMFRKLDQFSGGSKLETWLYRLATNEALQHLRKQNRHSVQPMLVEPSARDTDRLMESENVQMLAVALSRIDPELRAILSLKEEQDLSYREIAESLDIPEGTVGSRLNRARKELRDELELLGWSS